MTRSQSSGEDKEAGFPGLSEEEEDKRERNGFWDEAAKREDIQNVVWGDVTPGGTSTTGRIPR